MPLLPLLGLLIAALEALLLVAEMRSIRPLIAPLRLLITALRALHALLVLVEGRF